MTWLNLQYGARRQSGGLQGNPWMRSAVDRDVPLQSETFDAVGELDTSVVVLRTLIEDFGGEATSTSLSARVAANGRAAAPSRSQIRALFAELVDCGALTLENLDRTEVIARITAEGTRLAYAKRASGRAAYKLR